jgi:hypothetical protein
MEKAYDVKALAEKLKEKGLPEVENMAVLAYQAIKEWAVESAALSENKIDDVLMPALSFLDGMILPAIDKIDGKEG